MIIKCPCCNHKFPVSEDDILLDYSDDIDYDDSEKYVWAELEGTQEKYKTLSGQYLKYNKITLEIYSSKKYHTLTTLHILLDAQKRSIRCVRQIPQ